jgi:peroxiredoxin
VSLELPSVDGGVLSLASYRGKVVVLHVFATWATTSHTDIEQLSALHRERSGEVVVVGISFDQDRKFIAPWRSAVSATYVVALAPESVRLGNTALGPIHEVPATFLLDRSGRLSAVINRPLRPGELDPIVRKLLVDGR